MYKTASFLLAWVVGVETSTNEMRELTFLGILAFVACVNGLGDKFPFPNQKGNTYTAQATGPWKQDVCLTGTKQSPINVVSQYAISKSQPDFTLNGYEKDLTVDWLIDGMAWPPKKFTSVNFGPRQSPPHSPHPSDIPGKLSGGPLPNGER